jgi:hypothetical protein
MDRDDVNRDGDGDGSDNDDADARALARWLADARAEEHVAARTRVRRLVDQASEEGTLLSGLLDLAERGAAVRLDTDGGRAFAGVIAGVGRDVVMISGDGFTAAIAASAIASVRTMDEGARAPLEARAPVRAATFLDTLIELAADGTPVAVVVRGAPSDTLSGTIVAVGKDVVTMRTEGGPRLTTYVALPALLAVLLPSG